MQNPKIKRVLISVTDKTGVVDFARELQDEFGVEIVSTGGTARVLEESGVKVRPIDDLTGFPEMMDGRVKTLHPKVHGGLLARRDLDTHMQEAKEHGIELIDMIVVNLYAFEKTVANKDVTYEEAIENIDIGGPSMLRSAAKNHASVTVVSDPGDYDSIIVEMRENDGATTLDTRKRLAREVFKLTSAYDHAINNWLEADAGTYDPFAEDKRLFLHKISDLRYGENPHQKAAFYRNLQVNDFKPGIELEHQLAAAKQLQGKELSYNNYLDLDAAWTAVREFADTTCVIVKHLTPCGIATADDVVVAYTRAHECDPVSAYGGVMAFNREVTGGVIEQAIHVNKQFVEAIIAPSFDDEALKIMGEEKPNARLLVTGGVNPAGGTLDFRAVEGGMLVMESDAVAEDPATFTVPTKRKPTDEEMEELIFAWKCCKSVKSNAICITKDRAMVGSGAGQPNRVDSAALAIKQAGDKAKGAVGASDAFFPFADGLETLTNAGVMAVIEPGGSIRDGEVIEAADKAGAALVFTGHRHFRH
jgi:phosphoribosylaminoimidazolecarboxamide formyltransferase/IMP cyclohydrolase